MKLIAVDVDGTLLNSNNEISEKTKDALIRAGEAGHKVVIVSGRPTAAVIHIAKELEFEKYGGLLSNYNGGSITNFKTGEVISNHTLDLNLAKKILAETKDLPLEIIIPKEDYIISDRQNKFLDYERDLLKVDTEAVEDLRENIDFSPNKIIFASDPEILEEYLPFLSDTYGATTAQVRSQRIYYEIMPQGLSKGESLLEIANYYGINQKDIIAFGDELNDETMIEVAGTGVAMGNAVEKIKEIADYITLSNDEDGIADYLEKFILE